MRVDAALYTVSEIRLHGTASYCTALLSSIMHVSLWKPMQCLAQTVHYCVH